MTDQAETVRLILFTIIWTIAWVAPVPRMPCWPELLAGLAPFVAFGLRVFAGFFVGVPDEDPVRATVRPLLDWIDGRHGFPPYGWVLDATVALGMVWMASAFDIPRRSRIATAWIIPAVATLSVWSLWGTGLPIERLVAARLPPPLLGLALGASIGAVIRWTPSPIDVGTRQRAAVVAILTVPAAVIAGCAVLRLAGEMPRERAAQAESIVALSAGGTAACVGLLCGGFTRPRSRWLYALAVGVAAGAIIGLVE